jgi:hypothetical protein
MIRYYQLKTIVSKIRIIIIRFHVLLIMYFKDTLMSFWNLTKHHLPGIQSNMVWFYFMILFYYLKKKFILSI